MSVASPATAASRPTPTIAFVSVPDPVSAGQAYGDLVISVTTDGSNPVPAGTMITVSLHASGILHADGSVVKDYPATGATESLRVAGITAAAGLAVGSYPIAALYERQTASATLEVRATAVPTVSFTSIPPAIAPGGTFDDVIISATTDGITFAPAGSTITVELGGEVTFADGSQSKTFTATGGTASATISGLTALKSASASNNPIVARFSTAHAVAFLDVTAAVTGSVFAWGYNSHGAVGNGTTGTPKAPVAWSSALTFGSIHGGYQHFAAVTAAGTVYMTGSNTSGPFGNGRTGGTTGSSGPAGPALDAGMTMPFTRAERIAQLNGNYDQTSWVWGTDGLLYAAGENSGDKMSLNDGNSAGQADSTRAKLGFTAVGAEILRANPGAKIVAVSDSGWYRAQYLLSNGTVWNSGANNYFAMGNNGKKGTQYLAAQTVTSTGAPLTNIVQAVTSQDASLYLDANGDLWGAGSNTYGQLPGIGSTSATAPAAIRLTQPAGKKVVQIWANASDSESYFAKTTDGLVYAVGRNINGSNGVGHANSSANVWAQVLVPGGKTIADIVGGGNGNLFRMTDGAVYFAGHNDTGGPGTGNTSGNTTVMTRVPLPRPAIAVAATYYDSYAAILVD